VRRLCFVLALTACAPASADPRAAEHATEDIASNPAPAPSAGGSARAKEIEKSGRAHLLFVGDLSLTLGVGNAIAKGETGFPFGEVKNRILTADLAIGNLECVVSPLGAPLAPVSFRAPDAALAVLREAGFDVVSVANNHALDFGRGAYDDMLARLDASGLARVGSAVAEHEAEPVVRDVNGVRVAFLGYYEVDWQRAYREVLRAKDDGALVVVFNHWGLEDVVEPSVAQRAFAHGLVRAGADLVVGTHAHVLQPEETFEGKPIVYGLGNFVFNGTACSPKRAIGGVLEVDVDARGVTSHAIRRVHLDERGAPHWLADGETPASSGCAPAKPR
jgi:hypothetical protein